MVLIKWKNGALMWQGVIGNPQFMASFSGALFGSSHFHDMIWQGGAACAAPLQPREPPLRLPAAPGERELYSGAPGFMWGEPETAGDGKLHRPSRLAAAKGVLAG